ncbi:hypothetical protein FRC17_009042 [Serendipita sp. 399]|nr:hypothetical protein FRC17_009042 [Serendipita sp. 399]
MIPPSDQRILRPHYHRSQVAAVRSAAVQTPVPILAFMDSTPVLWVTSPGTFAINMDAIQRPGANLSFQMSVSLAYLDFLWDREAYLAALED